MRPDTLRRSAFALLLSAGACAPPTPRPAAAPAPPLSVGCRAAVELSDKARALAGKGKILRAGRLLGEAKRTCEELPPAARALEAEVSAGLGPSGAERASPFALAESGLAARASGDSARAQRLFDRAFAELGGAGRIEEEHGLHGITGDVVIFPDGQSMAVVHGGDPFETYIKTITILDTRTLRPRLRLRGHTDTVVALAVSPDGSVLASGSQDRTARLWDTRTGALLHVLGGHGLYVESVSFSPDGKRLATGSFKESRIWDVSSGGMLRELAGTVAVAYSPKGDLLATSTDEKKIALWDGTTGARKKDLDYDLGWVRSVVFSPDGTRLAASSYEGIKAWDVASAAVVVSHRSKSGSVFDVHFSADGARLFTEADGAQPIWDARTGQVVTTVLARHVAFSPDGKRVTYGNADEARLTDVASGNVERTLLGPRGFFLPNGTLLTGAFRGPLRVWDPASGALLAKGVDPREDEVRWLGFSAGGKRLVALHRDERARSWDLATGALSPASEGPAEGALAMARSPDGRLVATASRDHVIRIRDGETGALSKAFAPAPAALGALAFSPDGKLVAATAGDAVRVWEVASGTILQTLRLLPGSEGNVVFTPDGKHVVAGSGTKVWHWNLVSGAVVRPLEPHPHAVSRVAISPDGKTLASLSMGTLRLWDDETGKLRKTMDIGSWSGKALSFSPDGRLLALVGREAQLHDATTGAKLASLGGLVGFVTSVAFSPDGKLIAVGASTGSILLHRVDDLTAAGRIGIFRAVSGEDASYFLDLAGHVDFSGSRACAARERLVCRSGEAITPFEVCEDRARVRGLYRKVLAHEPPEEPLDADLEPLPCAPAARR